uniref:Uncharacterized protein n=1 Tax=Lotharella globosa TaxID=91324 RepID=A0A7S3Z0T5_9EUKA
MVHQGLIIYVDDKHWIKAGLEMEQGVPRMSCVATNEVSDWSYVTHPRTKDVCMRVHARLYKKGTFMECKIEYMDEKGDWQFLREPVISCARQDGKSMAFTLQFGLMCCAPTKKEGDASSMRATFTHLETLEYE